MSIDFDELFSPRQPPRPVRPGRGWWWVAALFALFFFSGTVVNLATDWMSLENQMTALRFIAIPFGLLAVIGTWLIARTLFPRSSFIAITASAFVAFQPQLSYEASMINNDILVIGLGAMLLALLVRGMRFGFPRRLVIAIGAIFGLMLLSKGSALAFAGASMPQDQRAIDDVLRDAGVPGFAGAWLRHRGLDWAAELLPSAPSAVPSLAAQALEVSP